MWETTQYQFLHAASREWLEHATLRGNAQGTFTADRNSVQNGAREPSPALSRRPVLINNWETRPLGTDGQVVDLRINQATYRAYLRDRL